MKLAYSSLACPDWTVEMAVEAAVRYGYEAIEWRLADGELLEPETAPEVWRRLRKVPAAHSIEIACLDTSCRVTQGSAEERAVVITEGKRMIDHAAELGAPYVRVFGGKLPDGATRAELLAPTAEVLHALGTYSAPRGITVLLETHDAWTSSEDVLALMQAANLPSVQVLWDTHHTYRSGETPDHTMTTLAKTVGYVHVKDSQPSSETPGGWHYRLLNEGTVPLREICAALKHGGYDGYISLEWEKRWHPEIAEPEIALTQAVPWLRRFWQEA